MAATAAAAKGAQRIYRHRLPVRVMHWINVICITILLMSGLNIVNAHPALYWGHDSKFDSPWLSIHALNTPNGPVGVTRIGGTEWQSTGVLGLSAADEPTFDVRFSTAELWPDSADYALVHVGVFQSYLQSGV